MSDTYTVGQRVRIAVYAECPNGPYNGLEGMVGGYVTNPDGNRYCEVLLDEGTDPLGGVLSLIGLSPFTLCLDEELELVSG